MSIEDLSRALTGSALAFPTGLPEAHVGKRVG